MTELWHFECEKYTRKAKGRILEWGKAAYAFLHSKVNWVVQNYSY